MALSPYRAGGAMFANYSQPGSMGGRSRKISRRRRTSSVS